jgi:hypothetical protein
VLLHGVRQGQLDELKVLTGERGPGSGLIAHGEPLPGSPRFFMLENQLAKESPDDPGAILTDMLRAGGQHNSSEGADVFAAFSRETADEAGHRTAEPGDLAFPALDIRPVSCSS